MTERNKDGRNEGVFQPWVVALIGVVALFFVSCDGTSDVNEQWTYSVPEVTGDGWNTASAESVGINLDYLDDMMTYINFSDYRYNIHSILIIRNGVLVFEEYFPGYDFAFNPGNNNRGAYTAFDRDTPHCMHSTTKSFTSSLIGIAIDQGFIPSDRVKMFGYFEDYAHLKNSENNNILLEHLLSNTSGLSWNENYVALGSADNDLILMNTNEDPIGFLLGKPVVTEPGAVFNYSGGNTVLLGDILKRASGLDAAEFSGRFLFGPLGITDYRWLYLANGVVYTSGDLYITPRSMAKFGQLFLNRGIWNGARIVSEEWIQKSTALYTSELSPAEYQTWSNGYGYCWWMNDYACNGLTIHTHFTSGWGGQAIYVIPELDSVVVFTAGNYYNIPGMEKAQYFLTRYILPSIHGG